MKIGNNGDQITFVSWFSGAAYQPDRFSFSDGTIVSVAALVADMAIPMGNDLNLAGTDGDDIMVGGLANDVLSGSAGKDQLSGGRGSDTMDGGAGDDAYIFNLGDGVDIINNYDTSGLDTISFGAGIGLADISLTKDGYNLILGIGSNGDQLTLNNWFHGSSYQVDCFAFEGGTVKSSAELLAALPMYENGTAAGDYLYGYEGVDIMSGGAGADTLTGYAGSDTVLGGDGNDNLLAGDGDDLLDAGNGDDSLSGGNGNDLLTGGQGTDNLTGDAGNDTLTGGMGSDILDGGIGNDTYVFNLGDGADTINNYDTSGLDSVTFGEGINLADVNLATKVGYNLVLGIGSNGDQLTLNNWFYGSSYQVDRFAFEGGTVKSSAELLTGLPLYENGTAAGDYLYGYEGVDIMAGGAGADTLYSYAGSDTLLGGDGNDILQSGDGDDLLSGGQGMDNLTGDAGGDTLTGGVGSDILDGGIGNDTYVFNLGDSADTINNYDTSGLDSVTFGEGINLADVSLTKDGYNLILGIGSNGDQLTLNYWFYNTSYQVDRFAFADGTVKTGAELLAGLPVYENGTTAGDYLYGYEGVDIMAGGVGADTFYGYAGADTLLGGDGNDNLLAGDGDDLLDAENGNDSLSGGNGNDLLSGGQGMDNLTGDAGSDNLTGGMGSDILDGGIGNDTYVFNLGDGADTINNYDTTGLDTVTFGEGISLADINMATKVGYNLVLGIGSNGDQLTLNYWFYNSSYQVDRFVFADGSVKTGAEILAGLPVYENGTTAGDYLYGYKGVDIMSGGAGADTLYGYAGADTLLGGDGNDILLAGDGDDLLSGGQGMDNLTGDAGSDTLTGGVGSDILDGGIGNDTYVFNLGDGADTINNYDTTGLDTVAFGEGISLADINLATKVGYNLLLGIGSNGDQLTLNYWFYNSSYQVDRFVFADGTVKTGAELLAALPVYENGTTAGDYLYGYEGVDIMSGGAGADTLYGYAGADTLLGGDGNDNLQSGDGNDLLSGGQGMDNLTGDAGSDTLTGGMGSDTLDGGIGNDTYVFNLGDGADTINNYDTTGLDTVTFGEGISLADINLATKVGYNLVLGIGAAGDQLTLNYWFYNSSYQVDCFAFADGTVKTGAELLAGLPVYENGTTASDYLYGYEGVDIMSGGAGADTFYGYAGADTLLGGDGNDNLLAGDGNDLLDAGNGNDILTGGIGNDIFVFNSILDQATNKDTITDFVLGQDKIELDKSIFTALPEEGTLALHYFTANATGTAGDENTYILYNTTSGALLYDADGNGQGVAIEFATLTNKPTVTAEDFIIAS